MDFKAIPTDAETHHRTKWSNDVFIFADDDKGAPSLYMFDRAGQQVFSAMVQIPLVDETRLADFAAAPDGSLWACGWSYSRSGQRADFLAHLTDHGAGMEVIRTTPYQPYELSVAPDGTVWTIGYERHPSSSIGEVGKVDFTRDMLRHFDSSGKPLASAIPLSSAENVVGTQMGFLSANQERVAWFSPRGDGNSYVEFSPATGTLSAYPTPPTTGTRDFALAFVLTPRGRAFVVMRHPTVDGPNRTLYEFNRSAKEWMEIHPPVTYNGKLVDLVGNDGESLVFRGPPDKSRLTVLALAQP
jgi:hypothetical protein